VDGLERDLRGSVRVMRVNIHTPLGQRVSMRYGLTLVPSFILFDGNGDQRLRLAGQVPSRATLEEALK